MATASLTDHCPLSGGSRSFFCMMPLESLSLVADNLYWAVRFFEIVDITV